MSTLQSFNPATGELVGEVEITPADRIREIVAAARRAQEEWFDLGIDERVRMLRGAAEKFLDRAEALGELATREMGKPLARGIGEVKACGRTLERTLDEIAEALQPEVFEDEKTRSVVYRDPFGVCAAITPWNYPFSMPHWLALPALAAGNSVVLKPSEETPLCGQAYADLMNEVLPEGVLSVIHGADEQGKAVVDADVDLIAFTGSGAVGKAIMKNASESLKRVILELGGKDPMIVMSDADLEQAARFAVASSYDNAGQMCVSTERIYVDESVSEEFSRRVTELTGEFVVGDGLDEATTVGPMVNERQRDHVLGQIEEAVSRGARVLAGGSDHHGNWVVPTVLADVTPEMAISQEETFGPVACITTVRDPQEAVRLANDLPLALGATVFGGPDAASVARRLTAGMIGVNRGVAGVAGTPWVGARQSGYGFHHSWDGHRQFTQVRVVSEPRPASGS
jgi:acyl-CoA reductase-like NAD-dependent aldehyde dehydrogenase